MLDKHILKFWVLTMITGYSLGAVSLILWVRYHG